MPETGILISTFDRIDDALVNMELLRLGKFKDGKIVHTFNGERTQYPEKYLEDFLIRIPNRGHFEGASDLLDAGIKAFKENYPETKYVAALSADAWILDVNLIDKTVEEMEKTGKRIAVSCWGLPEKNDIFLQGMATDFFIAERSWVTETGMFPLDYKNSGKLPKRYLLGGKVMLEKLAFKRFVDAVGLETGLKGQKLEREAGKRVLRISAREPVHSGTKNGGRIWVRKHYWPEMGLITSHDPWEKREVLKQERNKKIGPFTAKLLNSGDVSYFNKAE